MSERGEALYNLLSENEEGFYPAHYDEHVFLIVNEGNAWVDFIVEAAQKIDPEISDLDELILAAYDLENNKYSSEWWGYDDEWKTCIHCGDALLISATSAHWKPDYWFVDGEGYACGDCVRSDPDEYLKELNGNHRNCNTILNEAQLKELGFERLDDDYYCGLYDGHCDCPKPIMKKLRVEFPEDVLIFNMDSMHPFQQDYSVYRKATA